MTQQMYLIRKFDLIGATFYTYKPIPASIADQYKKHRFYTVAEKPKGYNEEQQFLPYTATVTEDLPSSCKGLTPKVYTNCKLMTETHGSYVQFYHEETKQVLRIAMNSHFYTPSN